MATKFDTIVDAIAADYAAQTGDSATLFYKGRKYLAENDAARRVVFIRDGGTVTSPTRLGPQLVAGRAVQPVRSRVESVTAYIFAGSDGSDADADSALAESMLDGLLGSIDAVLETALVEEPEYAWWSETEEGAKWQTFGVHIVLRCLWRIGVTRGGMQVVYPQTFTATTTTLGRGDFSTDFSDDFRRIGGEAT